MWLEIGLGLLALLLLLPLVPVDLAFEAQGDALRGTGRARSRIEWLFGLVRKEIRPGPRRPRGPAQPRLDALAVLRSEGFLDHAGRFARRLLRAVRVKEASGRVRFGTSDPADTGRALGVAAPVVAVANAIRPDALRVEPAWTDLALEGSLRGRLRVRPYPVLAASALFFLSPTAWRAFRAGRREG